MKFKSLFRPYNYIYYFKRRSVLKRFKSVGTNFKFDPWSSIMTPHLIEVGDNVFIGEMAHISAEVRIGNNIMFGPRPMLLGGDHYFGVKGKSVASLHPQGRENSAPIIIEDESWMGAGVILLKGVVIGMGAVVGAGSVANRSIPPYCMAAGQPCRPRKLILEDSDLVEHIDALGYGREFADKIVARRTRELREWKLDLQSIVDQTGTYWETKDLVK